MANYPAAFEKFTEDEFERQELEGTYVEPTSQSDPHYEEVRRISHQLAVFARGMSPKHRQAVQAYFQGKTKAEITQETGMAYETISKALHSTKGLRLLSLLAQLSELRSGPSQEARRAMLWRIARRSEYRNPTISLKALDILNKQSGDYGPDDGSGKGMSVTIKQFIANMAPQETPVAHQEPETNVIEGEFAPVTVTTPDA